MDAAVPEFAANAAGIGRSPSRADGYIGILVWSPLAGGFLAGKYSSSNPAPAGTRFAEAGQFVPFDKGKGYASWTL
jgi:aryl-alcohol dehydrogenase-like predicted oxidoreductase